MQFYFCDANLEFKFQDHQKSDLNHLINGTDRSTQFVERSVLIFGKVRSIRERGCLADTSSSNSSLIIINLLYFL